MPNQTAAVARKYLSKSSVPTTNFESVLLPEYPLVIFLDHVGYRSMHDLDENAEIVVRRFVPRSPADSPLRL